MYSNFYVHTLYRDGKGTLSDYVIHIRRFGLMETMILADDEWKSKLIE
jgi:hypothetical protein